MKTSESIVKISAALAEALPAIGNATKDASNPAYRSTYATLNAVMEAVKPELFAHGIVVVQGPGWRDGVVTVTTRFLHSSGEWIETEAGAPVAHRFEKVDGVVTDKGPDAQTAGSAISYLRRYSLAAMAGITQEDDDGNAASGNGQARTQPQSQPSSNGAAATGDMIPCPACGSDMWDNRADEKSAINGGKRPDIKCKDKACDHAIWLKSWRDDLVKELTGLHEATVIDAAERERAEKAVATLSPEKMATVAKWVHEKGAEATV